MAELQKFFKEHRTAILVLLPLGIFSGTIFWLIPLAIIYLVYLRARAFFSFAGAVGKLLNNLLPGTPSGMNVKGSRTETPPRGWNNSEPVHRPEGLAAPKAAYDPRPSIRSRRPNADASKVIERADRPSWIALLSIVAGLFLVVATFLQRMH